MATNVFCVLILASIVSSGYGVVEIRLPDLEVNHIGNSILGRSIGIPKHFEDTLRYCHVIFPNGVMYEAYPNDNIPHPHVWFEAAVSPFTSCTIGFRGVGVEFSGVYELLSTVMHSSDYSLSLTRRKFDIRVSSSEMKNEEVQK